MAETEKYSISKDRGTEWTTLTSTEGLTDNEDKELHVKIKVFSDFLNDKEFFTAWNEGYDIDNECFKDTTLTLKKFFKNCKPSEWMYAGPGIVTLGVTEDVERTYPKLGKKVNDWRAANMRALAELNVIWLGTVAEKGWK